MAKFSDKELVEKLMSGSTLAFEELYAKYKDRLLFFCNRFLKNNTYSEDLIQDVFIQIWENRHDLNPDMSFSGYIHTSIRNRILNIFRQSDVHDKYFKHIIDKLQDGEIEDVVADMDYAWLLENALETLSPKQKEVFQLSRINGLKYREISEILNISIPTVQEHASIALKKLREYIALHADIDLK